ncbi:MAG: hypothetical protein IBJ07_19230 [Rhizobiaceae bacterium]|nr:hypothetical protein [Rhizobiaceae bacterium]
MRLLDIARSAYVGSPVGLRRSIAPLMAMVPTSLKYGGAYRKWRADIARSVHDPSFADARRRRAFAELLAIASKSPFYREIIGGHPRLEPHEIARLPVLTKEDLTAAGTAALAMPRETLDAGNTSGSNGEAPFGFYLDRDRSVREIAFIHHVWSRCGFQAGAPRAMLRDAYLYDRKGFIHEWEAALGELRLSVFPMTPQDMDLYLDLIDQRGIRYLHGFPSAMEMLSRHMLATGRRLRQPLEGVFPISEPIFAHQRETIRAAFGNAAILPFYGMSEKAIFAGEVAGEPDTYECEPLYGIAELVDDAGTPITEPGREGRLVGTSFITRGMPFIRYDTEDRATLVRAAARENGWRMRIRAITPRRKPAWLVCRDGRRIVSTDFTPSDPAFFDGIKEFQFYQDTPGVCVMKYVPCETGTAEQAERIVAALQSKAGEAIRFRLEKVDTLVASSNGKRPFIDQRLSV